MLAGTGLEVGCDQVGKAMLTASDRVAIAEAARPLSRIAFGVAIVLSPFRARVELLDRPSPPVYEDFTNFLLFWSDAAVLITLALWVASLVLSRRRLWLGPIFLRWPAAALVSVAWLSAITSIDPALSIYAAVRISVLVVLALYVANEIDGLAQLLPALAVMIGLQAIVAVGQVLGQESVGWSALGEYELNPAWSGVSVVGTADGERFLRAYGLSDHPNILGGVLAFGLLAAISGLASARERARTLCVVVIALGTLALAVTFSRAAILAFGLSLALAIALLAWRRSRSDLRWWIVAAVGAAVVVVAIIEPYGRYFRARADQGAIAAVSTETRSLDERAALMEVTNDLVIANPLLGTGAGTLPLAIQEEEPQFAFNYQPAHVVLLDVAAEVGLAGAVAYSSLIVGPWVAVWARRSSLDPPLIGASAVLAAVTLVGLFDYYPWSYAAGQLWAWVALGAWAAVYAGAEDAADA